jgi:hypothetical protein
VCVSRSAKTKQDQLPRLKAAAGVFAWKLGSCRCGGRRECLRHWQGSGWIGPVIVLVPRCGRVHSKRRVKVVGSCEIWCSSLASSGGNVGRVRSRDWSCFD